MVRIVFKTIKKPCDFVHLPVLGEHSDWYNLSGSDCGFHRRSFYFLSLHLVFYSFPFLGFLSDFFYFHYILFAIKIVLSFCLNFANWSVELNYRNSANYKVISTYLHVINNFEFNSIGHLNIALHICNCIYIGGLVIILFHPIYVLSW